MAQLPNLITVSELREYLHISNRKAYELVKNRNFPSIKIGNKYLINADELPTWLNKQASMKR